MLTVDNVIEPQECIVSQTGAVIPVVEQPETQETSSEQPPSPEKPPPEPVREVPRLVPGFLAVCSHCGYLSEDFNRCQRCHRKMPEEPKAMACGTNMAKQTNDNKKAETPTTQKPKTVSPGRLTPKTISKDNFFLKNK